MSMPRPAVNKVITSLLFAPVLGMLGVASKESYGFGNALNVIPESAIPTF